MEYCTTVSRSVRSHSGRRWSEVSMYTSVGHSGCFFRSMFFFGSISDP